MPSRNGTPYLLRMCVYASGLVLLGLLPTNAVVAQSIAPKIVDRLKQATAIVRVTAGETSHSAGGFLVRLDDKSGYVVTSLSGISVTGADAERDVRLAVSFPSSGPSARFVQGELLASDDERDLALLKIPGNEASAQVVDLSAAPSRVTETMAVFAFVAVSDSGSEPAEPEFQAEKAAIVAIRKTAPDEPGWVRVDKTFTRERSGCAVVDTAGRLVGLARVSAEDADAGHLTPRGDVKTFVDDALKSGTGGPRSTVARKPGTASRVKPVVGKRVQPKFVSAQWGPYKRGQKELVGSVDALGAFLRLLESGQAFQLTRDLFPAVDGNGLISSLRAVVRVGNEECTLILTADSRCQLSDLPPELAKRSEAIWLESAVWCVYPDGGGAKDVTEVVRARLAGADGVIVHGVDLGEIEFGRPKMLKVRMKLGAKLLEISATEPSYLHVKTTP
jgi:S1-C subfamily serine protease